MSRWVLILSGGEGTRLRSFVREQFGKIIPKQYCVFSGNRSMLEHTIDRASNLVPQNHIVTVLGKRHGRFLKHRRLPGKVVEQPRGRDTGVGVMLGLSYIQAADPKATVVLFPSDHFIFPKQTFLELLEHAVRLAETDPSHPVILAAAPDRPETEYGWIEPGARLDTGRGAGNPPFFEVRNFCEKPSLELARQWFEGGFLWNTMILAGNLQTLWHSGLESAPEMMKRFTVLLRILKAIEMGKVPKDKEKIALTHLYRNMPVVNFSRTILTQIAGCCLALPLVGVTWSDWGREQRIRECLRELQVRKSRFQAHMKQLGP